MPSLLEARGIKKHFGGVRALEGVSLQLQAGKVLCLAGENGSGKSTLIKILAGVLRPDAGRIVIKGEAKPFLSPRQAIRAGIQVIYQDLALFPNLTVAENLALNTFLEQRRIFLRPKSVEETARRVLDQLALKLELRRPLGELSRADRQLVAIARALLQGAQVVIMDEPTAALTHREALRLLQVVGELKRRRIAVLFVSHRLEEILAASDTIVVLRNGRTAAYGPTADFDAAKLSEAMTGRSVKSEASAPHTPLGEPLLEVRGLTRQGAFHDVSFTLRRGEILGLAGLRGAGRGALLQSLFGLVPPEAGTVKLAGRVLHLRNPNEAVRAGIAYLPEDRLSEGIFVERSTALNLAASVLDYLCGPLGTVTPAHLRGFARKWISKLAIKSAGPDAPVGSLSGGNQQKVLLGRWLATNAELFLLNRPTVGVDVAAKEEIHRRLAAMAAQGAGLLVVSDDPPELARLCRRVLLLHRGRIEAQLTGADTARLCSELARLR